MKSDSPFFDRIRVKPDKDRRLREQCPACEWPNCQAPATHRAPKGRLREREYWRLCLEHVREYNHAYNFFAGMSPEAIARYQKETAIGHRSSCKNGMNFACARSSRPIRTSSRSVSAEPRERRAEPSAQAARCHLRAPRIDLGAVDTYLKSCEFQLTTRCLSRPGGFLLNWRTNPPRIPSTE